MKLPPKLSEDQLVRLIEQDLPHYIYQATGRYNKRGTKLTKGKWYLVKGAKNESKN